MTKMLVHRNLTAIFVVLIIASSCNSNKKAGQNGSLDHLPLVLGDHLILLSIN